MYEQYMYARCLWKPEEGILELDLQGVVSRHMGAESGTQHTLLTAEPSLQPCHFKLSPSC